MTGNRFNNNINLHSIDTLKVKEFNRLSNFIMSQYGIKMPPVKRVFLQSRLQKRLKSLSINSFEEYTKYLFSAQGQKEELENLIDSVSTNKTDFFREPVHFRFLLENGLDNYLSKRKDKGLKIWSAGCSSGEEPFSIAMTMNEYALLNDSFRFKIFATDISTKMLEHAKAGIFKMEKIDTIPIQYHRKYLLKGKNSYEDKFRIHPDIMSKISFQKFNLLSQSYNTIGNQDIIFCRNVLIYFERKIQDRILNQISQLLNPGGFLFLGHSESITGFNLPLEYLRPTIFMKKE